MVEKKTVTGRIDHHQQIMHQASKLAEMLRQSPEYTQYMSAREKLEADEGNTSMLAELRQQQMAVHMSYMMGEGDEEAGRELEKMFSFLAQEPVISDYLFAEGRFFRLISDVENIFSDRLGLNDGDDESGPLRGADGQWLH